jgi:uncharacterized alkaline shock family protein YloU
VSAAGLSVGRGVVAEMVRLAAVEVPGVARVGRGGPAWRRWLGGESVGVRLTDDGVLVHLFVVARPGQRLVPLAHQVRDAVCAAVERLLGMHLESVTVVVDGVGG